MKYTINRLIQQPKPNRKRMMGHKKSNRQGQNSDGYNNNKDKWCLEKKLWHSFVLELRTGENTQVK